MAAHLKNMAMPAEAEWTGKVKTQVQGWPYVHRDDIVMALVQGLEDLFPVRARGVPPRLEMNYVGW